MAQAQVLDWKDNSDSHKEYSIRQGAVTLTVQRIDPNQADGLPTVNVILKVGPRSMKLDRSQWRELIVCGKDVDFLTAFVLGHIDIEQQ